MTDFFKKGWETSGVNPKSLSQWARRPDRWDQDDWKEMIKEIDGLAAARDALGKVAPTGKPALADAFWTFVKVEPELAEAEEMNPAYLVNRYVAEEMEKLQETERARRHTQGDVVGAAMAALQIEPDLETLFDKAQKQIQAAQQLAQAMQQLHDKQQEQMDLDSLVEKWKGDHLPDCTCEIGQQQMNPQAQPQPEPGDGQDQQGQGQQGQGQDGQGEQQGGQQGQQPGGQQPGGQGQEQGQQQGQGEGQDGEGEGEGEGQGQGQGQTSPEDCPVHGAKDHQAEWEKMMQAQEAAQQAVDQAAAQAEQAGEDFQKAMEQGMGNIRLTLREAMEKVADAAESQANQADAWGLEPGELQRMNAAERIALAKRLDNPRFKRIADIFGAMKNLMLTEVSRKTIHATEEVFDVVLGQELDRILPEQLGELLNPATRMDFLRKFAEGELLQYDMKGTEKLAQGGIIFCEDGSGSMHGEREMWAKAVCLCLLHLARMQKRPMHVIHFGSPGQYKLVSFNNPEDFKIDKILDVAELFFGGGTDFATPMTVALGLLQDEHRQKGAVEGDIVFCTDGMCGVPPQFMEDFKEEQKRLDFAFWGINIGGSKKDEPLNTMCDGKVATIQDLLSGEDVRMIFRGM